MEDVLLNLKTRLAVQGKILNEFYVDICCSWRQRLKAVFGDHIKVYLDLFHAVKRITDAIPKRHPLYHQCVWALTKVFRDPTDLGKVRQKPTPSPGLILANIDAFIIEWGEEASDGKKVLPEVAKNQINNLRKHIEKGCLSGIHPGRGTNRNEALHKSLNSHMSSSRYGVEMAYMLLTTFFYNHNEKINAQREKRQSKLISEHRFWLQQIPLTDEKFGLMQCLNNVVEDEEKSVDSNFKPLHFDRNSYYDIIERFMHTSPPQFQKEYIEDDGLENDNIVIPEEVSIKDTVDMLLRAIGWYAVYNTMSKYTSTAVIQCTDVPFMKANFGTWINNNNNKEQSENLKRLTNVLQSWNFVRVEVPGDGNCLFTSVAITIISMCQQHQSPLVDILQELGIDPHCDSVETIVKALRRAVVNEWTGDHSHEYADFLSHTQLEQQGQLFLQSGEFSGELGDLVIAALSNILHSPIILFTSIPNLPVLVISPSHEIMHNPQPIHLAFTQEGPGHYDVAIHNDGNDVSSMALSATDKCTCGKKTSAGVACTTVLDKYASRCPCYNSRRGCNELCTCKNCQNPFGKVVKEEKCKTGTKRKRRMHESQKTTIRGVKTKSFMEESKLQIDIGQPTAFERLVTLSILQYCTACEEVSDFLDIHAEKVLAIYNCLRMLAIILQVNLPMYRRSVEEIGKLIFLYASKQIFFGKNI